MAQGARQSSLFAAEDFSVIYESFAQANLQAYDFDTIRNAMVDYISTNYAENFNDWISSSEFVSLIELMAFLGHNLAFRADLATRENFLSTAERRESALRIAEFLGYTPSRNVVANGLLKVDSIKTTENIYDVDGNSLANVDIQFDDINDANTYQNFLIVMNSFLQQNSKFGSPYAKYNNNNIQYEIYRTNSFNNEVNFPFSGYVNGGRAAYGMHSLYYNQTTNRVEEKSPNPFSVVDLLYKNDNGGFNSLDTGFFIGFKQGSLNFKDFAIENGLPNMVLDINDTNVANGNVWVQTIDEVGQVLTEWTQVDRLFGLNAVFNIVNNNQRKIFTISSRENDQISIVFGDGNFGDIPRGIVRVWYRTGINQTYNVLPNDIGTVVLSFNYISNDNNVYTATVRASLKATVSNSSARESIESIRANAGRFFSTQDRMITADDYSIYPITVSENIRKIKSINRVHSGHSRFRDFYDPTATYSDAVQYTDDAYLYKEDATTRSIIPLPNNVNAEEMYQRYIRPILNNPEVKNFYYHRHFYGPTGSFDANTQFSDTTSGLTYFTGSAVDTGTYRWNQVTKGYNTSTGYITLNGVIKSLGSTSTGSLTKLEVNGLAEFITTPFKLGYIKTIEILNKGSGYTSAPTVTIEGTGNDAAITANVLNGEVVSVTITNSGSGYQTYTNITFTGGGGTGALGNVIVADANTLWARVSSLKNNGSGEDSSTGTPIGVDATGRGAVVLSQVIPSGARIKRIVPSWEYTLTTSVKSELIANITNKSSFGLSYDPVAQMWTVITASNLPSNSVASNDSSLWSREYASDVSNTGLDNSWLVRVNYASAQWELLTRKTRYVIGSDTKLRFNNLNFTESFSSETLKPGKDSLQILSINTTSTTNRLPLNYNYTFNSFGYFTYTDGYTDPHKLRVTLSDPDNDGFPNIPSAFHDITSSETINLGTVTETGYNYVVHDPSGIVSSVAGRANLHMKYNRVADLNQVIDPSSSNIIDTMVLLRSYETAFNTWALYDGREYSKPSAPTVSELSTMFSTLDNKKSISDQIVYRPVKFKILFGELASSELQATFRVVKTSNATMSDTEIKQQIVRLITEYFSIDNWDFGETFHFTEMAAYIHTKLIGQLSQITIYPSNATQKSTTSLFEIPAESDEMFLPVLTTSNILIVSSINSNSTLTSTGVIL
tara:strand:- start:23183 stop:26713 length:3531 start_codon:yes stop_codon:yes gene_type:complete